MVILVPPENTADNDTDAVGIEQVVAADETVVAAAGKTGVAAQVVMLPDEIVVVVGKHSGVETADQTVAADDKVAVVVDVKDLAAVVAAAVVDTVADDKLAQTVAVAYMVC